MRRATFAALALAGGAVLGLTTPASAAEGVVIINNQEIQNPSGCHNLPEFTWTVDNQTNETIVLYGARDCEYEVGFIDPWNTAYSGDLQGARSVKIGES